MNINELFFFKVFECIKDSNNKLNKAFHNEKSCYFYHKSINYENDTNIEKDKRREQISFTLFFKKLRNNLEGGNKILTLDTIFEFKNRENNFDLIYYTNKPSFQNYNNYIYNQFDCCKNETEFLFHIKNYQKNKCRYSLINQCKKKFCDKYHYNNDNSMNNENEKNGINKFKRTLDSWIEKNEIKLMEIIELFNIVLTFENKYLSKLQLNEIKKDFEPFLKFYNENKSKNINSLMNINKYQNIDGKKQQRIMQEIMRDINQNDKKIKIYKNTNLFQSLQISTNICYLPSTDTIKSGELIKYIYAFLNSSNGAIIYGASLFEENNYIIKGISIKQKEREKFKKWFNTEFLKILVEYEGHIKFQFYDLVNNNNEEECVLVIYIKQIKQNKFLISNSNKYLVIKEDLLNKNKEKNQILNENDIVELDSKQYIEFLRKRFLNYYSKKFGVNMDKTDSL